MSDESMSKLVNKVCLPCTGSVFALDEAERTRFLAELDGWSVVAGHHLSKQYPFPDFLTALDFVNRVGAEAERNGHHPDILLTWGMVRIEIYTHKIDGLTESDFILAAKCDALFGA